MKAGFFNSDALKSRRSLLTLAPQCGECKLDQTCKSPKMPISGKGKLKILIIGEAPGKNEDLQGRPFVGDAGQLLGSTLRRLGIEMRQDCYITNANICRPVRNATPSDKQVEYCRPNIIRALKDLAPELVILLGKNAVQSVIPYIWKNDVKSITRWVGWRIPSQKIKAWVCPTYHPSHISRAMNAKESNFCVLQSFFTQHLKNALKCLGKRDLIEQRGLPQVERILSAEQAGKRVRLLLSLQEPIAWDLETNMLKPDSKAAKIFSCSLAWKDGCISYPWYGDAIKATGELLQSDIPKIGHNCRFEQRWIMKEFGFPVNNWVWDSMIAAHVLDNRRDIAGLKFQSFVRLGVEEWDTELAPYLKSVKEGGNEQNTIHKAPLDKVLLYNGLDSLYTLKIAQMQMKDMKIHSRKGADTDDSGTT